MGETEHSNMLMVKQPETMEKTVREIDKKPVPDLDPVTEEKIHKDSSPQCNNTWVVRSHPTIPYSGLFCSKCDLEK